MTVERIDYVYLETRNFGKAAKFWQKLGFELVLDLGTAGRLEPPGGGVGIHLEEVSPETPLAQGVYLRADTSDFAFEPPVEAVTAAFDSHWNTRLQVIRDPDGRELILQHYLPEYEEPAG